METLNSVTALLIHSVLSNPHRLDKLFLALSLTSAGKNLSGKKKKEKVKLYFTALTAAEVLLSNIFNP